MLKKKKIKVKTYIFKIIIEEDNFEDGMKAYHAYCPALKGASTWGYTQEEALKNIQDVSKMVIESMIKHKETLPKKIKDYLFTISSEPLIAVTV